MDWSVNIILSYIYLTDNNIKKEVGTNIYIACQMDIMGTSLELVTVNKGVESQCRCLRA